MKNKTKRRRCKSRAYLSRIRVRVHILKQQGHDLNGIASRLDCPRKLVEELVRI